MRRLRWNPAKWGFLEAIIAMTIPSFITVVFIAANLAGTRATIVAGHVLEEKENWTLRHGYRCYVDVDTTVGKASQFYFGRCRHVYIPGQSVAMRVHVGRLDGEPAGVIVTKQKGDRS